MTMRPMRVTLPHNVADWPRSRALALATRCARDQLARTGDHMTGQPPAWVFEPAGHRDDGPLTVAVGTVALESRDDVIARAQALMAARTTPCEQCDTWAQMNLYRFERGLTIREACAALGLNSRTYYRHQLVHPTNSNGRTSA